MHSQWHSATQPIPMAQRHPHHALPADHNGTARPTRRPPHQSQRHSAFTQRPPPPITTAQCHPHDVLPAIPNGTALPTRRPTRQSRRRSASDTNAPATNPDGTAHRTPHAHHQSPWHSHIILPQDSLHPGQSPTAQRSGHDTPTTNPHGTATQNSARTNPIQANPEAQCIGHLASVNVRERACANTFLESDEHGPAPRPPNQKTRQAHEPECILRKISERLLLST